MSPPFATSAAPPTTLRRFLVNLQEVLLGTNLVVLFPAVILALAARVFQFGQVLLPFHSILQTLATRFDESPSPFIHNISFLFSHSAIGIEYVSIETHRETDTENKKKLTLFITPPPLPSPGDKIASPHVPP
jgi:hypothetical protein